MRKIKIMKDANPSHLIDVDEFQEGNAYNINIAFPGEFVNKLKSASIDPDNMDMVKTIRFNAIAELMHLLLSESRSLAMFYHECFDLDASIKAVMKNHEEHIQSFIEEDIRENMN